MSRLFTRIALTVEAAVAAAIALATVGAPAHAQTNPPPTRGQLLYTTHCIACHDSKMHWRDERLATDWASLKAQVSRWQANARLQWSDAEITEVARHLNDIIYRYPRPTQAVRFENPAPLMAVKLTPAPSGHTRSVLDGGSNAQ